MRLVLGLTALSLLLVGCSAPEAITTVEPLPSPPFNLETLVVLGVGWVVLIIVSVTFFLIDPFRDFEEAPFYSAPIWWLLFAVIGVLLFVLTVTAIFYLPLRIWLATVVMGYINVLSAFTLIHTVVVWLIIIPFVRVLFSRDKYFSFRERLEVLSLALMWFGLLTIWNLLGTLITVMLTDDSFFEALKEQYIGPFEWLYKLVRWLYSLAFG